MAKTPVSWPLLAELVAAMLDAERLRTTPEHLAAQLAAMDAIRGGNTAILPDVLERLAQLNDRA